MIQFKARMAVTGALGGGSAATLFYLYAGWNASTNTQDNDEFTPSGDSWSSKTDLPAPARRNGGCSTIGSAGYIYGAIGALTDCDEYTPDTWASKTNKVATREYIRAFTVSSAGYALMGSATVDCDEYVPDTWTAKTGAPSPGRDNMACSAIGSAGYSMGGYASGSSNHNDEYTPVGDSWASKTDVPAPTRYAWASSNIGTAIYTYGGYTNSTGVYLTDCDKYVVDTWTAKTDMPSPVRGDLAGATAGSSGYIGGGFAASSTPVADCDEYTPSGDSWASKTNIVSPVRAEVMGTSI